MNVKSELRRLIREALVVQGGSGGRRECKYCLRESFKGQAEHYLSPKESHTHCEVIVMRAALKALRETGNG